VDEPGGEPATAIAKEAFAINPVAAAMRIFDTIIIA
jgi:hypothetical protein